MLTPIELMHLKNFCRKFEIDDEAEIDATLTYNENKTLLQNARIRRYDELAQEYAKGSLDSGRLDYWSGLLEELQEAYSLTMDKIKEILTLQTEDVLMGWFLIGKEIELAREHMRLEGGHVSSKGWSGEAGKLMTKLSLDLHLQKNELYDAVRFVQRFPKWEEFELEKFDVPVREGGVLESFQISGSGLSWNQVRKCVLRKRTLKSTVRPNLCWDCGKQFFSESAPVCEQCKTFVCPDGHCFCKIPEVVQKAIDYEMMSRGPQPPRWNGTKSKSHM